MKLKHTAALVKKRKGTVKKKQRNSTGIWQRGIRKTRVCQENGLQSTACSHG